MTLANFHTTLICVFSFMEFLHFSDVINITRADTIIKNTHIGIFIEKSKTDAYQEGSWVYLTKLSSFFCPISLFTRYCRLADIKKRLYKIYSQSNNNYLKYMYSSEL